MGCQSFSASSRPVAAPIGKGDLGPQGRGGAEPWTGSSPSPTVALIKDNQAFHSANINLGLFFVLPLTKLRVSVTVLALSHFTEVALLRPEPG